MAQLIDHQACYFAHDLTRLGSVGELDRISATLFDSKVDLNPHQVEAALFAIANPLKKGVILADEVGLGKTIEAGLVLCQKWAERKRKLIIVTPAHIRKQWQAELSEKFSLPSIVVDRKVYNTLQKQGHANPLDSDKIIIMSYGFAARMKDDLRAIAYDLVVFDEAHKLRNAYQTSRKGGQAIRWAFELRQKLLLTATPLQNSLLELYGLGWLIDDHLFGDKSAFQSRYTGANSDLPGLRSRLNEFCKRTLRKDCPYVNYRERHAMTHPFAQTKQEKSLYEDVMEFMTRDVSFAFPIRQRQLIEMIVFKTLASSPQALASTLMTMRNRLIAIRDGLNLTEEDLLEKLGHDDDLDLDDLVDRMDDDNDDASSDEPYTPAPGRLLAAELTQLDTLILRAQAIGADSKSKALLQALQAAFDRLSHLGASRKALIFTESRKTQDFLAQYLEANGYAGRIVTFNGSNNHPTAKKAYDRFTSKYAGTDKLTGSKAVDIRSALIEEFRDHADILLATEAAAEGVNLQFCSMVVNYDLPWNPQRIEQRIGRCHRYGQQHDVVVVNFLSQDNLADRRVHDLLKQKFNLFDGLFGASDEVLGAIEDNIDFENRVINILKTCRTPQQINDAFDILQKELETTIAQKMSQARQTLFEHFDPDVHERLQISPDDAKNALDRVGQRFWKLAHWGLDQQATFDDDNLTFNLPAAPSHSTQLTTTSSVSDPIPTGRYTLISNARTQEDYAASNAHLLRLTSPLGQWLLNHAKAAPLPCASVTFNVSDQRPRVSVLQQYVNQSGWLRLDKLTLDSDTREEFLLFTAITDQGQNLDQEAAQRLLDHPAQLVNASVTADKAAAEQLTLDAKQLASATQLKASEASNKRFATVQTQINQWAEDRIAGAEYDLEVIKRELKQARRNADTAVNLNEAQVFQQQILQIGQKQRRARNAIFDLEDEVETQRKKALAEIKDRINQKSETQQLFVIRWSAT